MPARLDQVAENGVLPQLLASFQTVQPFDQDEALPIGPHQNWHLLSNLQNALGNLLGLCRIERCSALGWDVDAGDRKLLLLHHGFALPALSPSWRHRS